MPAKVTLAGDAASGVVAASLALPHHRPTSIMLDRLAPAIIAIVGPGHEPKKVHTMGSIGAPELIIVGIIVVLLFGATRLPATAKGLGQALKLFKKEVTADDDKPEVTNAAATQPAPAPAQTQYQQAPVAQPQYQSAPPVAQPQYQAAPQPAPAQPADQQPPVQQPSEPQSVITPGNQG